MTPLFKSVAEAPHSRTQVHRARTLAQAWCPGGTNTEACPAEVTGERVRGQGGADMQALPRPARGLGWPCRAVPAAVGSSRGGGLEGCG